MRKTVNIRELIEKPSYSDLLKSPKWQKKRLEILNRDNFTCQLCGDTETQLQVHHKRYITGNDPWEYGNNDLITACQDCHKLIEDTKNDLQLFSGRFKKMKKDKSSIYLVFVNNSVLYAHYSNLTLDYCVIFKESLHEVIDFFKSISNE